MVLSDSPGLVGTVWDGSSQNLIFWYLDSGEEISLGKEFNIERSLASIDQTFYFVETTTSYKQGLWKTTVQNGPVQLPFPEYRPVQLYLLRPVGSKLLISMTNTLYLYDPLTSSSTLLGQISGTIWELCTDGRDYYCYSTEEPGGQGAKITHGVLPPL